MDATEERRQYQDIFDTLELIEETIKSYQETPKLISNRWISSYNLTKELGVDPKTLRKLAHGHGWKRTKLGAKVYYDIEMVRNSMESNAKTA